MSNTCIKCGTDLPAGAAKQRLVACLECHNEAVSDSSVVNRDMLEALQACVGTFDYKHKIKWNAVYWNAIAAINKDEGKENNAKTNNK